MSTTVEISGKTLGIVHADVEEEEPCWYGY